MPLIDKTPYIQVLGRRIAMPKTLWGRRLLGGSLVVGGVLGFLPILGFWMFPLGIIVISYDSPRVRRWWRRISVRLTKYWRSSRFSSYKNMKKITGD